MRCRAPWLTGQPRTPRPRRPPRFECLDDVLGRLGVLLDHMTRAQFDELDKLLCSSCWAPSWPRPSPWLDYATDVQRYIFQQATPSLERPRKGGSGARAGER